MEHDNLITLVFWKNEGLKMHIRSGQLPEFSDNTSSEEYFRIYPKNTIQGYFQNILKPSDVFAFVKKQRNNELFGTGWYNVDSFVECVSELSNELSHNKQRKVEQCR